MPRSVQKIGLVVRAELVVFDPVTDAKITGLVNADFTKRLVKNGVTDFTAVTVSEIDPVNRPGEYEAVFTPATIGEWYLYIFQSTFNPRGWDEEFDVTVTGPDLGQRVIDGFTVAQMMSLLAAASYGKVSGAPLAPVFRSQDDAADRITGTSDASGDRLVSTLTPPPP